MNMNEAKKFILPIVQDFDIFAEYIKNEKPVLTPSRKIINRKDCYTINDKLSFKIEVDAPKYNQEKYTIIEMFYVLGIDSGLCKIKRDENKCILVATRKLERFLKLNNFEKYVFLLGNYWRKYEFDEIDGGRRFDAEAFYQIVKSIAAANNEEDILSLGRSNILFFKPASLLYHFYYLGIIHKFKIEKSTKPYDPLVEYIVPTELGIEVCKKLSVEGLKFLNVDEFFLMIKMDEVKGANKSNKSLFLLLKSIFPKGLVENTVKDDIKDTNKENKKGMYSFKVSLSKDVWRKIRMSHDATLYDLHDGIQYAFGFDNDHMFEFRIKGMRQRDTRTYSGSPNGIDDDITLEEANFYKGQEFDYIFDFGHMWEFYIEVIDIDNAAELSDSIEVFEEEGEAPEQYSSEF